MQLGLELLLRRIISFKLFFNIFFEQISVRLINTFLLMEPDTYFTRSSHNQFNKDKDKGKIILELN